MIAINRVGTNATVNTLQRLQTCCDHSFLSRHAEYWFTPTAKQIDRARNCNDGESKDGIERDAQRDVMHRIA